ncbi:thioredoxin [Streptomyces phage Euratis]|uniref:Thioredoxin n=1 Tax=Streptomyces phage Euratis TaxID=2510569 RepID=A0A411B125_9CAUD|nr:thioredoxin [Streptomyces phage Euratis]
MILPVLIGLRTHESTRVARKVFEPVCWAEDAEPEFVSVASYDSRADGVTTVPTIRVYDDADPYGDPLVEHVGAVDADSIRALLTEARTMI